MKKLLDLSDECVKSLSKKAIDENTDFKNLAQDILERESKPLIVFKKIKNIEQKLKKLESEYLELIMLRSEPNEAYSSDTMDVMLADKRKEIVDFIYSRPC